LRSSAAAHVQPQATSTRVSDASTASELRVLQPRPAARVGRGADLLVRVHLLRLMRERRARPAVPQLRRRACSSAAPSRRQARQIPGVDRAGLQASGLRFDAFDGKLRHSMKAASRSWIGAGWLARCVLPKRQISSPSSPLPTPRRQQPMARVTGNFKRGNERVAGQHSRNRR
jgi:hypothetical protein